jgi:hypothetical protein
MQEMVVMLLEETLSLPSAFNPPTVSPIVESVGRTPTPARSFKPPVPLTPPEALLEMTRYYRDRVIVEGETEDAAEAATRAEYKCVPGASEWIRPPA